MKQVQGEHVLAKEGGGNEEKGGCRPCQCVGAQCWEGCCTDDADPSVVEPVDQHDHDVLDTPSTASSISIMPEERHTE